MTNIEAGQTFKGGHWWVKVDGEVLRDKHGNYRYFKTEEAAIKAAKKTLK